MDEAYLRQIEKWAAAYDSDQRREERVTSSNVVPLAMQVMGIFCMAVGVGFFIGAWIYEVRYLGG